MSKDLANLSVADQSALSLAVTNAGGDQVARAHIYQAADGFLADKFTHIFTKDLNGQEVVQGGVRRADDVLEFPLGTAIVPGGGQAVVPVLSPFLATVKPFLDTGRLPRFTPVANAPVVTSLGNGYDTPPSGYVAGPRWDEVGAFRWEGGYAVKDGGNDRGTVVTYNQVAYTEDRTQWTCNVSRLCFKSTGQDRVAFWLLAPSSWRVIVDGAYITQDGVPYAVASPPPPYGSPFIAMPQGGQFELNFGAVGDHEVIIEGLGALSFHQFFVRPGGSVVDSASPARPRVYIDGTSVGEFGFGWTNHATHGLNVDGWNCCVGGTGVLNPGPSGVRVNMVDRANWRHGEYALGFGEHVINDGGGAIFGLPDNNPSVSAYNVVHRMMVDQYRRFLDSWGAAQGGRPWFCTGYYPSLGGSDEALSWFNYPLRDALEYACGEYAQFARFFADPFPTDGVLPGTDVTTYPARFYRTEDATTTDVTHPDTRGHRLLGVRRTRELRRAILTSGF